MRVLAGMLVALVGAAIGAAAGVLVPYALLSGQGVNALVWAVTGVFFGIPAMLAGAIGAGLLGRALSRDVFPEMGPDRSPIWSAALYGVGASIVLAVGGPIVAAYYSSHDAASISLEGAPNPVTGAPCKKSGIRYSSALGQKVYVCFTLSADRSEYLEYGWEFGRGSG